MNSNILKELRIKKCLTQDELAEKTKMTRDKISYYERGLITPTIKSLSKLVNVLDISNKQLKELVVYFGGIDNGR